MTVGLVTGRGVRAPPAHRRSYAACCCNWRCLGYQQGMATFLPTDEALRNIAQVRGLQPNDPAVVAAFDRMVLSGQLLPWLPGWWEVRSPVTTPPRR